MSLAIVSIKSLFYSAFFTQISTFMRAILSTSRSVRKEYCGTETIIGLL